MTQSPPGAVMPPAPPVDPAAFGLACYATVPDAQPILAELEGGDDKSPALLVLFRPPSAVDLAHIEARAREATLQLLRGSEAGSRYGLAGDLLKEEAVVAELAPLISAVESASLLIKDWNFAEEYEGGWRKRDLTVASIAELFKGRPRARQAWNIHLDNASPMERREGNGSAASPGTTSGGAANTAETAPISEPPAPGEDMDGSGSSAPGPSSDP